MVDPTVRHAMRHQLGGPVFEQCTASQQTCPLRLTSCPFRAMITQGRCWSCAPEEEHVRAEVWQRPAAAQARFEREEKLQIYQRLLSGELSQRQAAERWDVDPTTIMRIRRVAREGALSALAQSRPGRRQDGEDAELAAARAEIERLSQNPANATSRQPAAR